MVKSPVHSASVATPDTTLACVTYVPVWSFAMMNPTAVSKVVPSGFFTVTWTVDARGSARSCTVSPDTVRVAACARSYVPPYQKMVELPVSTPSAYCPLGTPRNTK